MSRIDIMVERLPYRGRFALHGREVHSDGSKARIDHVTLIGHEPDDPLVHRPFLELSDDDAQRLLEELWRAGLRPVEVGNVGERDALIQARDWAQSVVDRLLTKARF